LVREQGFLDVQLLFLRNLQNLERHFACATGFIQAIVGAGNGNGVFEDLAVVAKAGRDRTRFRGSVAAFNVRVISRRTQRVGLPLVQSIGRLSLRTLGVKWRFFRRNIVDDILKILTDPADIIRVECVQFCYRSALYPTFLRFPASSDYIFTQMRVARSWGFVHIEAELEPIAMSLLMAGMAEGHPIAQIIAKFRIVLPTLDVMGVQVVERSATLADAIA
jgi:hypothetical protein